MDELEFRRRAYANPYDNSTDFIKAARLPKNQALLIELQALDFQLTNALQEPVPAQLLDRLLAIPKGSVTPAPPRLTWRHLAIAASLTFVLGFSTRFVSFNETSSAPFSSMGQTAMAHVYAESALTQRIDEQVTLASVNAKLQPYGTQLQSLTDVGHVYYANHCLFDNGPAAHLVIQGEQQRVHVFVVPPKRTLEGVQRFSDEHYHGEVIPMDLNHLVVISEKDENIELMAAKIQASLKHAI
ncbi:DUF3379 family protein [Oceanisphaera avium]|uniref:DUF3379 domain-containing protein n=1 Tax=Oceanisphaera avium TaxID=1903694 RepID=A0A1Y0CV97_9GAMM|nr:DUF3379 family protein [Oceanisphaera avium]ART79138.1 hypothetical protein CBP12_02410 [Oceanisphaera avium]